MSEKIVKKKRKTMTIGERRLLSSLDAGHWRKILILYI